MICSTSRRMARLLGCRPAGYGRQGKFRKKPAQAAVLQFCIEHPARTECHAKPGYDACRDAGRTRDPDAGTFGEDKDGLWIDQLLKCRAGTVVILLGLILVVCTPARPQPQTS